MKTRSIRSVLPLFSSNFLAALVGGLFFLSASLSFNLYEMGLYAVLSSIQWIIAGLVSTGLGVAIIRLSADYLSAGERDAAAGVVAFSAIIAASITASAVGICLGLTALFSNTLPFSRELLVLTVLWAGARSILNCLRSGLLAQQLYARAGFLMVLSAMAGLVALGVVLIGGPLTLQRLLVAHVFGLGMGAVVSFGFMIPLWNSGIHITLRRTRELLIYACWPTLSEGIRLLQAHLGPLLIMAIAGSKQAGLFSLGRYPTILFGVVAMSLYQYWLPEAAREDGYEQRVFFLRRQMWVAGLAGIGILLGAYILRLLLPLLGANFTAAASLLLPNALDFALLLQAGPIIALYHSLHKPHLELVLGFSCLPLLLGAGFVLVASFGAMGMAWTQALTRLVFLGLAGWLLWRQLRMPVREMELHGV